MAPRRSTRWQTGPKPPRKHDQRQTQVGPQFSGGGSGFTGHRRGWDTGRAGNSPVSHPYRHTTQYTRHSLPYMQHIATDGHNTRHPPPPPRQALDTYTRQLAKNHFKLLQATHHSEIIRIIKETKQYPPGMLRQANKLTQFIKPSTPTQQTQDRIHANTQQWLSNNLDILETHYNTIIDSFLDTSASELALTVAANWASRRYGARFNPETITLTRDVLNLPLITSPYSVSSWSSASPYPPPLPPPNLSPSPSVVLHQGQREGELDLAFIEPEEELQSPALATPTGPARPVRCHASAPAPSPLPPTNNYSASHSLLPSPNRHCRPEAELASTDGKQPTSKNTPTPRVHFATTAQTDIQGPSFPGPLPQLQRPICPSNSSYREWKMMSENTQKVKLTDSVNYTDSSSKTQHVQLEGVTKGKAALETTTSHPTYHPTGPHKGVRGGAGSRPPGRTWGPASQSKISFSPRTRS